MLYNRYVKTTISFEAITITSPPFYESYFLSECVLTSARRHCPPRLLVFTINILHGHPVPRMQHGVRRSLGGEFS